MRKENENIFLHIIGEDYRRNKMKQKVDEVFLREAEQLSVTRQIPSSVILELEKMSIRLEAPQTPEVSQQIDRAQIAESSNEVVDFEFLTLLQRMGRAEQELLEQKQAFWAIERELQGRLVEEIETKKMAISNLKSEISDLEDECKELAQVLGIPL